MTEAEWLVSDDPDELLDYVCQLRWNALGIGSTTREVDLSNRDEHATQIYHRKRRLFACACCLRLGLILPIAARNALLIAERFADGEATDAERAQAVEQVEAAGNALGEDKSSSAHVRHSTCLALKAAGAAALRFTDGSFCVCALYDHSWPFLNVNEDDGGFTRPANDALRALATAENDSLVVPLLDRWNRLRSRLVEEEPQSLIGKKWYSELLAQCHLLRDIFANPFRPAPALDPAWLRWHDATIPRLAQQMYDSRDFASMPILADALEEAGCTSGDILDHCRGPGPHVRGCWVVDLILGKECRHDGSGVVGKR